ncbi:hypothetical protein LX64_00844 [Chitinophaga skermanii]|uniref:Uncharacterized protein n=1 Tax=Chitinophaga skermanii TaxID=331697 RepID=A0A327R2S8_9BACT|nr:hypothetical protein [Chitinophaga skermanii]RAJ08197.1 hypothetical protein LX64_00844 [Chitinophaga skermanii]
MQHLLFGKRLDRRAMCLLQGGMSSESLPCGFYVDDCVTECTIVRCYCELAAGGYYCANR